MLFNGIPVVFENVLQRDKLAKNKGSTLVESATIIYIIILLVYASFESYFTILVSKVFPYDLPFVS
ncbi:Uncharacterised protein [uncultured Bacteroides sp.]|nr:Uncharacterised protein [uncultured Bacteroides sp.]